MAKTRKLKVEPMTAESFEPFGELIDIKSRPSDERIIAPLGYHAEGRTTLSALWQPFQGRTFWQLERHFGVTQSFTSWEVPLPWWLWRRPPTRMTSLQFPGRTKFERS